MVKMSTVWDRTTEFLGSHLGTVLPIAALGILLPTTIATVMRAGQATAPGTMMSGAGLIGIAMTLVTLWATTAITALAIDPGLRGGAAKVATQRLLPVIGVTLLLALLAGLLVLPIFAILAATGFDFAAAATAPTGTMPQIAPAAALSVGIYTLLLLPLMAWLLARLVIVTPVVVAERRGVGAIARAWRLSRGHALRIIGVVILYVIVLTVATFAITSVAGVILTLVFGVSEGIGIALVLAAILGALVSTALSVLQAVFVAKLYVGLAPQRDLAEDFA